MAKSNFDKKLMKIARKELADMSFLKAAEKEILSEKRRRHAKESFAYMEPQPVKRKKPPKRRKPNPKPLKRVTK